MFSRDWVQYQLVALRPPIYGEAIRAWEAAPPEERPSHLISGAALAEAPGWAKGKRLSDADQKLLEASRAAELETTLAQEQASLAERLIGLLLLVCKGALLRDRLANDTGKARHLKPGDLKVIMHEFGINTPIRQAAFLAMIAYETIELTSFEEFGDGSLYEGRNDMGNKQPSDGRHYKGRGAVMLAGRGNYQRFGDALDLGLISHPEVVASSPELALLVGTAYWN